jgi:hypothetical protein
MDQARQPDRKARRIGKFQVSNVKYQISNTQYQSMARGVIVLLAILLGGVCALVPDTGAQAPAATTNKGRAGNYCVECHATGDARLARAFEWQGGIESEQVSPCPTLKRLREQVYYTESLLGAMTNSSQSLRALGVSTTVQDRRVTARMETYGRLTQEQVTALAPVETEIKSLRLQMNKSFSQMYQGWGQVNTRWAIVAAGMVTLLLAGTVIWRLTRQISNIKNQISSFKSQISKSSAGAVVAIVIVFLLFALPVFSTAAPASTAQTEEQASRQEAINQATIAGESAERAAARAWMLARIGASWAALDEAKGQDALAASLDAMHEFQMNGPAYGGRIHQLQESAVTWATGQDAAADAADRIAVAAGRAWALRAIAAETAPVDRASAEQLLAQAAALAEKNENVTYRDMDLYGVAIEWARLDANKGLDVARTTRDPLLQAAALREIGALQALNGTGREAAETTLNLALQAARQAAVVEQIWALQELGVNWAALDKAKGAAILGEAQALVPKVKSAQDRAYILRNLAAAWAGVDPARALQVAESIDPAYPEARASALGQAAKGGASHGFDQAIESARQIDGAYRRDVALASIARDWAATTPDEALDVAATMGDVYLRADVQQAAALALATASPDRAWQTAQDIPVPFLRTETLVRLGARWADADRQRAVTAFQSAAALADELQDTYPMQELAVAWARIDSDQALAIVDKIQRDVDRAAALREVSVILAASDKGKAGAVFDRALAAATSMRRAGDSFASAEALRQLGEAWAPIDKDKAAQAFAAAFESAKRVSVKY